MLQLVQRFKLTALFAFIGIVFLTLGVTQLLSSNAHESTNKPLEIKRVSEDKKEHQSVKESIEISQNESHVASESASIKVDVSGAVVSPGVYEIPKDARINIALDAAGGISKKGDSVWVGKNLNLATKLQDGDKVFIPAIGEIKPTPNIPVTPITDTPIQEVPQVAGISTSQPGIQKSLTTPSPAPTQQPTTAPSDGKININTAGASELDTLSGVGPVTAQKIIDNRPYTTLEELKEKKAVNKSTFEKIKDKIKL